MEGSPVAAVATGGETHTMDTAKRLYRRLDALFGTLKPRRFQPKLLESFLEECFASLRDDLRLSAGLLYGERRDGFSLIRMVGDLRGPVAAAPDPPPPLAILSLLDGGGQMEELDFALNTIRVALDARLIDARVRGSFREAAEIQRSLLVEEPPAFPGYEIACRSVPPEGGGGGC